MNRYLHKVIKAIKLVEGNQAYALIDTEYRHLWYTDKYLEICGVDQLTGLSLSDLPHASHQKLNHALQIIHEHLHYQGTDIQYVISFIHPLNQTPSIILVEHKGIFDPQDNQLLAWLVKCHPLTSSVLNQMQSSIRQITPSAKPPLNIKVDVLQKRPLKDLEEGVLFLLLLGKTYRDISAVLMSTNPVMTENAVKHMIHDKLLKVFSVKSVDELILKAVKQNALHTIPKCILKHITTEKIDILYITP